MSSMYHLRIDVRRIQDYIFQVPRLKYMLGANSKIGELFSCDLPGLMGNPESIIGDLPETASREVADLMGRNILSSSGGHFEALFREYDGMRQFFESFLRHLEKNLPDLEWSASYREFNRDSNYSEFEKIEPLPLTGWNRQSFADAPYYQLCANDGVSIAREYDEAKKIPVGEKSRIMLKQSAKFYNLESDDAIAKFYTELDIGKNRLADELETLAKQGQSLKSNMLAYVKIDGNGTGDRFRRKRKLLADKNVLEAFLEMEIFWSENRKRLRTALMEVLQSEPVISHASDKLPYLLLMLGGDDLFLICVPELALDFTCQLAAKLECEKLPVSAGIAYTKTNYPISLANNLAESCLETAKAASYRQDIENKPPFIDWHVHFDSFYQDITEIRRNSYMLEYMDSGVETVELLCGRPYHYRDASSLADQVRRVAAEMDKPEQEIANNKIKSYRSVLKNGCRETVYFREMILGDNELGELLEAHSSGVTIEGNLVKTNHALDRIELLEFYRKK